jgi:hypothetical protein
MANAIPDFSVRLAVSLVVRFNWRVWLIFGKDPRAGNKQRERRGQQEEGLQTNLPPVSRDNGLSPG